MNVYYKNNLRRKQNVIIYNDMFQNARVIVILKEGNQDIS